MDQKNLRQLEAQCIQEEPPRCQAACPLHVDVRALCAALKNDRVNEAWAVLCRTMPLPGLLARICDGPCARDCLRAEAGSGIRAEALERYCAENATRTPPLRPMPSRGKALGVLGAGLAGLSAAWDLARKGFDVTLYATDPGARFSNEFSSRLSPEVVQRELESLKRLGAVLCDETPDAPLLERLANECEAVFVDLADCPQLAAALGSPNPVTLETSRPKVFAGASESDSPVLRAASGRRGVLSMERLIQGVSMTAQREKEGPHPTRLYTSLAGVQDEPAAPLPESGPDKDWAVAEAARCLDCQCMECVRHCVYLEHYKGYPKTYARQIYNNASIVMGTRHANRMINSCMLCGLCETLCPEDFSMAELCLDARRDMVARDKMPPSAHEFALRDMAFANGEHAALTRHAPDAATSAHVFFPGCQLTASDPGAVRRAYAHLAATLPGGVGLMLSCCGAPAQWSGREALFAQSLEALMDQWETLGRPAIITACPTCQQMLGEHLEGAEITSIWEALRTHALPRGTVPGRSLALHDPCTARHDADLRAEVRALLTDLRVDTVEPELTGETTECCGYGGLLAEANPPLADEVIQRRAAARDEDWVTYCAMCRDRLARAGRPALHLLDLIFPPPGGAPEARPAPGYSERRENRAHLKQLLLLELWGETPPAPEGAEDVGFKTTDEAAQRMEQRRILVSDVQKVLAAARASGRVLQRSEDGRLLACHRPVSVTYWVEYEEMDTDILVHNVWSHRMRILGGGES